jgi:hypothetical protein
MARTEETKQASAKILLNRILPDDIAEELARLINSTSAFASISAADKILSLNGC